MVIRQRRKRDSPRHYDSVSSRPHPDAGGFQLLHTEGVLTILRTSRTEIPQVITDETDDARVIQNRHDDVIHRTNGTNHAVTTRPPFAMSPAQGATSPHTKDDNFHFARLTSLV